MRVWARLAAWWRRLCAPATEACPTCGWDMICDEFYQAHGLTSQAYRCLRCWTYVAFHRVP